MIWAIGVALHESLEHDPRDGRVVDRDLGEYHNPGYPDVPRLDVMFLHQRDDRANPIEVRDAGELGISGAGAAVTNPVFDATGARLRDHPATLDRILPRLPGRGVVGTDGRGRRGHAACSDRSHPSSAFSSANRLVRQAVEKPARGTA